MVPSGGSFAELGFTRKRSREDMQLERPASVGVDDENMHVLANEGVGDAAPQSWESQRIAQLQQELANAHSTIAYQQAEIGALRCQVSTLHGKLLHTYGDAEY